MIIPIKTSDKIQHLFIIKTLNKADIEGTYPNTLQAIYEKPTANIIGIRQVCLLSPYLSNKILEVQATAIRQKKKQMKVIKIGKKEVKLSVFADDMILSIYF